MHMTSGTFCPIIDMIALAQRTGADPGVLEKGFICIKVFWFALLILSHSALTRDREAAGSSLTGSLRCGP